MAFPHRRFCGLFLALGPMAAAAEPSFLVRSWETDDGLPHNGINSVIQTRNGFLWLATQGGLCRFDGSEFMVVRSPLLADPRSSRITSLIEERPDRLLAACDTSGLVVIENGRVSRHPLGDVTEGRRRIALLFREADGVFWILFSDRELWRCEGDREVRKFPLTVEIPATATGGFARTPDGRVFITRGHGLEYYDGRTVSPCPGTPEGTLAIAPSADGGVWVAGADRLGRITREGFRNLDLPVPWSGAAPVALVEDREHALWIGLKNRGLQRWDGEHFTEEPATHSLIRALHASADGTLWVATAGGGLNRLQHARFSLLDQDHGWVPDIAGSLCQDHRGRLWFSNNAGIWRLEGDQLIRPPATEDWPKKASAMCPAPDGRLWIAAGTRLYSVDPEGVDAVHWLPLPEALGAVHSLLVDRRGTVWAGGDGRVIVSIAGGETRLHGVAEGFTGTRVHALAEDARGSLWAGTEDGRLFERRADRFLAYGREEGLSGSHVRVILPDPSGILWIGTGGGGLVIRQQGRFSTLTEDDGLPDDVISQLLDDGRGSLWFGTSRALFKVRKDDLLDRAAGRVGQVTAVRFGKSDGLAGFSATSNYQPASWTLQDGRLAFATRKGPLIASAGAGDAGGAAPRVQLGDFLVDSRVHLPEDGRIPSAARKFDFTFAAPVFIAPEQTRFRCRLHGLDEEWTDLGPRRTASYSRLAPGRYRFEVSARHGDGPWSREPAFFVFEVSPAWWETWWARSAGAALFTAALVALVRLRSHRLLRARLLRMEARQRIESERARIARDLHDGLGAGLTQAGMMAEELAEDCTRLDEMKAGSSRLAERIRSIALDLDAAVWTVSPKNDTLAALCAYLGQFALESFRDTPVRCRIDTAESLPGLPLSPDTRNHLFLAAKEIMNNVLKHSGAREMVLAMQVADGELSLSFTDDGGGFDPGPAAAGVGGNGLPNLAARVAEAGGRLSIASSAAGTRVEIHLPLAACASGNPDRTC